MAKFATIVAGKRERKTVKVRIGSGDVAIDLRVLTPEESITVLDRARSFAAGKGGPADSSDPVYNLGLEVYTLQIACIDTDSPKDAPVAFFDSADAILQSELLSRDTLSYLFTLYEEWLDESSCLVSSLTDADFIKLVGSVGGGEMLPFCALRPGMQWAFVRSLVQQYLISLAARSTSTAGSSSPPNENSESATKPS